MLVGPVLSHKLIEATPWNLLQYAVEYTIVVLHGLILLPCPKTSPNAWSTEESMPCTLSTKFKPDSRGTRPGMTDVGQAAHSKSNRPILGRDRRRVGADDFGQRVAP